MKTTHILLLVLIVAFGVLYFHRKKKGVILNVTKQDNTIRGDSNIRGDFTTAADYFFTGVGDSFKKVGTIFSPTPTMKSDGTAPVFSNDDSMPIAILGGAAIHYCPTSPVSFSDKSLFMMKTGNA